MIARQGTLLVLAATALAAADSYTPANSEWNRPNEPFRIVGNLYYVGASDVSSYLFTTPAGHILLDAGFRESAPIVEANIRKLGFRVADIRLLLISHGHYDHIGGMAEIKAHTQAPLLASPAEVPLLARGGKGDFAFGDAYTFPPLTPDRLVRDGNEVSLGGTTLTAHLTPGHTQGCTTWTATIDQLHVVIPCSLSAPGYQLVNNPKYPRVLQDFEASLATLSALPCDVFLSFHSWDFDLHRKRQAPPESRPFVDPQGYRRYLERSREAIRKQAAKPVLP